MPIRENVCLTSRSVRTTCAAVTRWWSPPPRVAVRTRSSLSWRSHASGTTAVGARSARPEPACVHRTCADWQQRNFGLIQWWPITASTKTFQFVRQLFFMCFTVWSNLSLNIFKCFFIGCFVLFIDFCNGSRIEVPPELLTTPLPSTDTSSPEVFTKIVSLVQSHASIYEICSRHEQCPEHAQCRPQGCKGFSCLCDEGYMASVDKKSCVKGLLCNTQ